MSDDDADDDARTTEPLSELRDEIATRQEAADRTGSTQRSGTPADSIEQAVDQEDDPPLDDLPQSEMDRPDTQEQLFEQADTPEIDTDTVWEQLEMDQSPSTPAPDETEHVVEKRKYCDYCQYLSSPPEMHCTHEGTTIVELVDLDHVRVRDCPIVRQNEELDDA